MEELSKHIKPNTVSQIHGESRLSDLGVDSLVLISTLTSLERTIWNFNIEDLASISIKQPESIDDVVEIVCMLCI